MTTLLESRISHRRLRLLSRKARESEIDNEEPPRRRLPCPDRNRSHDGPSNVCFPNNLSNSSVVDDVLRKTTTAFRRRQGQRRRRDRERNDRVLTPSEKNIRLRAVCAITATRSNYTHNIYRFFLLTKTGTSLLKSE